ncbi:MAG: hypothetical protein JWQ74_2858 [Marmoricola sp.]|nr:hypothetical protein [Marmoricola sp.]
MSDPDNEPQVTFDQIATDLQALRAASGHPSYADIVRLITEVRTARGVSPEAARPARTTVYEVFRHGRHRVDAALVGDIARALGADEADAREWEERCRTARQHVEREFPRSEPTPAEEMLAEGLTGTQRTVRYVAAFVVACVAVNLLGRFLVDVFSLPLYLDMIGTAVSSISLGPWWGALVGLLTNLVGAWISGAKSIPFALVNIVGALIWGYGVRRFPRGLTIPRFFALNVVVAFGCTSVAVPIILAMGGHTGHDTDTLTGSFLAFFHSLGAAVFSSNIISSLADKLISGFVALAVLEAQSKQRVVYLQSAGSPTEPV